MRGSETAMPAAGTVNREALFSTAVSDHTSQPALQKLNKLDYEVLPYLSFSPDLSPTNYHFFKHLDNFLQGKPFHKQEEADNAFQEFIES